MPRRNLSEQCKSCNVKHTSIKKCMDICMIPLEILVAVEHERSKADGKIMKILIDRDVK